MFDAISMMTSMPAEKLGLAGKGRLSKGSDGDVVIFDPEKIEDKATFAEPTLPPEGIDYVIINGEIAAKGGKALRMDLGRSVRK